MTDSTVQYQHRSRLLRRGATLGIALWLLFAGFAYASGGTTERPIGTIGKQRVTLNKTLVLAVGERSPEKAAWPIVAEQLPPGASLTDNGDGTAVLEWSPQPGDEGVHEATITRSGTGESETFLVIVGGLPLSHGFYRLGYGPGLDINVGNDHLTHSPVNKLDLNATAGGPGLFIPIVAAADGRIRDIVDFNLACCSGCAECNNFIWIEHSNGEWTKYSHPITASVSFTFGWTIGDCVQSGDTLGWEGDVGSTSCTGACVNQRVQNPCPSDPNPVDTTKRCGVHLHFEVRQTSRTSELRVPLICEAVSDNFVVVQNNNYTSANCGGGCPNGYIWTGSKWGGNTIFVLTASDDIVATADTVTGTASVAFFAGDHITLKPGFVARKNSYFHAMIKPCRGQTTGCPPL